MGEKIDKSISVVVPVYGCKSALPELHRRLVAVLEDIADDFELVLVDDRCPQNSWERIEKICMEDHRVTGIRLSRNFGQIRAITAGLDVSRGDWVVVMDCDLQDRPEAIRDLLVEAEKGYDVVFARRTERKDSGITKLFSRMFYRVYDYFTDGNYDSSLSNFSISKRIVIENYCQMREQNRGYTTFIKWLGFNQTSIDVEGDVRFEGESSYSFKKKLRMAFELITAQSIKPLKLAVNIGFVISMLSFLYLVVTIIRYFLDTSIQVGWTSVIASIYLVGGLLLAFVGVVGLYVGNIFNEVKDRPLYVISDVLNGRN